MISESTNKNKGFTLLEVIAAIFVLTVGVLAAYSVTSQLISSTHLAANRLTAVYLAKEGIEIVRNIRDTNWVESAPSWDDGLGVGDWEADYNTPTVLDPILTSYNGGQFLNLETGTNFYGYGAGTPTNFKRKITISDKTDLSVPLDGTIDMFKVTVEVTWQEKGETKGPIRVIENLYNWY